MNKDKAINFRVDEETNKLLLRRSKKLGITKSAYICQVLNSFDEYKSNAEKQNATALVLQEREGEITKYKERAALYQTSKLNEIYQQNKGKSFNGKVIRSEGDLLRIMIENFEVNDGVSEELQIKSNDVQLSSRPNDYYFEKILSVVGLLIFILFYFLYFVRPRTNSHVKY